MCVNFKCVPAQGKSCFVHTNPEMYGITNNLSSIFSSYLYRPTLL